MTKNEKFEYWLNTANQHYKALDMLQKNEHYLLLMYSCQQTIEMLCKGIYELYNDDNPPLTHNLITIFSRFSEKLKTEISEEQKKLFRVLSEFYINGRYPDYKMKLATGLTKEYTADILKKTKEAYEWLLTLKP